MFKKLNLSKRALAAVALVASIAVFAGLIGAIQYYKNRPVAEQGLSVFTEVTSANFQQEILQSQVPVYVLFYVDQNCKPCEEQMANIEKVSKDYAGKVKFVKINAQKEQQIAQANGVTKVPTSFFINPSTGQIIGAQGVLDDANLRKFIDTGLAPATPDPGNGNGNGGTPPVPPAKDNPEGK